MPKQCLCIGCTNPVYGKGYCKFHQYLRTDKQRPKGIQRTSPITRTPFKATGKPIRATKINTYSKKRQEVNKNEYQPNSKAYREAHPLCEIKVPGICNKFTEGVHHLKGKATKELLLDQRFWLPACNACNTYIEDNSQWAKENGFKIPDYNSKLSNLNNGKEH